MKVLIIGSGGREHAIAYKLSKSKKVTEIHAIPGNPGISKIGTCHTGSVEDLDYILSFVEKEKIDLTVVGPEVPLCMGLVDLLEDHGHLAFGPRKQAATLEGSKVFSKEFMKRHNIPTAISKEVDNIEDALTALADFTYPLVIKADGLAAGKGVIICQTETEAKQTLEDFLVKNALSGAGKSVVIEEFLEGYECSLLCFTDGKTIIPMVSSKDHKQIYNGNKGPNTGGMGTISPNPFMKSDMDKVLKEEVLDPFMKGLEADNLDYRGVIFIGLMINNNHAKVLEFNVRFGDPETQVIMLRLESDLYDIMYATATSTLDKVDVKWKDVVAGCVVLASAGYPGNYEKGKVITGLDLVSDDIIVFHAGTKEVNNQIITNGGRVLNICTTGENLDIVRNKIYQEIEKINFEGKYCRKDIGLN